MGALRHIKFRSPGKLRKIPFLCAAFAATWLGQVRLIYAGDLTKVLGLVIELNEAAAESQKRVTDLAEDTATLLAQYRSTQQQIDSLKLYLRQVETMVNAQNQQVAEMQTRIDQATQIGRQISPLMLRMIDTLDQFVGLDLPFLLEERRERVAQLRALMDRPDVTDAEKFRRILESYQIENDYGRTIETYRAQVNLGGKEPRTVNLLRVGRVALIYMSIDEQELGVFNPETRKYEVLGPEYRASLRQGFRIARKQVAPDLFFMPIPAPRSAK